MLLPPELVRTAADEPRLVIAAGGEGTVGSVAGYLAGSDNVPMVLPLGTGNDSRALDIPLDARCAAELATSGQITAADRGRLTRSGQPPADFAHAATVGLNVDFAKLATHASVRARLGRLTYLAAAVYAMRERSACRCELQHDGVVGELNLLQLSVMSAPVIGGSLGLDVRSPHPDDHRLDVLAVEDVSPARLLRAGVVLLLGIKRTVSGVRALHGQRLGVNCEKALEVTLDGELAETIPGEFEVRADALRVLTARWGRSRNRVTTTHPFRVEAFTSGVALFAHVGGFVFGVLVALGVGRMITR